MSAPPAQEQPGWSLGPVLIVVGIATLILARDIPEASLGNNQDPGPRAFPAALACLLLLGGIYEVARVLLRHKDPVDPRPTGVSKGLWRQWLRRPEDVNVLILVGTLGLYLLAMPWVGFPAATLLFSVGMMLYLGSRWTLAVPVSVGLVAVIYLLFALLFRVQLPAGVLGLSW